MLTDLKSTCMLPIILTGQIHRNKLLSLEILTLIFT